MAHQETPEAGGDGNPADANPATAFEDIAAEMLGEEEEERDEAPAEADDEGEPEAEADDEADIEVDDEDVEPDLPAIEPPHSLTAEEKEAFAKLPREAQEFTARRIGELEKGFQTKAQEAAQKERTAMREAAEYIQQSTGEAAEVLEYYANLLVAPKPPARLMAENPALYAQMQEDHDRTLAQREQAQQQVNELRAQQQHYQQILAQERIESDHRLLSAELPEFFDPTEGPKLRGQLEATARALGFTDQELAAADAKSILTLKKFADLQVKAEKFDRIMAKQMEKVRAGKGKLPPVSKPGVAKGPEASRKAKADQAWKTAQTAKTRNARDEALADWMTQTGLI